MTDEVKKAIQTLIAFAGDDPNRAGVLDTPKRIKSAYKELFAGYKQDGLSHLKQTRFANKTKQMKEISIKAIPFTSYCEHHMLPIIGHISLTIRLDKWDIHQEDVITLIDIYAKRLQIQEKLNAQIIDDLYSGLDAKGVAGSINSVHYCMKMRGVNKAGVKMHTHHFKGDFINDPASQQVFLLS